MALVRRATVYGRQVVQAASAIGVASVPRQPSAADVDEAPGVTMAPEEVAAAPTRPARLWAVLTGLGLAAAGAGAAYLIYQEFNVRPFRVGNELSTFGALFVFAAAVERLMEPFTRWMPGRRAQDSYERMVAAVANRTAGFTLTDVAVAKSHVDQHRADKGIITWGLATAIASVVAASAGFYLLRTLAADPGWSAIPAWIDALITGLVVGSGTKPLHDLLTRVQKGNVQKQDPAGG